MGRDRAAYMREYRARKRGDSEVATAWAGLSAEYRKKIAELEEEVRHLKAELAKAHREVELSHAGLREIADLNESGMPITTVIAPAERFNSRPFTPVPKKR